MIKVTVQYNDHLADIHFPCSETTLRSALMEIHAADDNPPELFVTEVIFPEELGFLKDRFVNMDELNYLAKRMESFCGSEDYQFFEAMKQEAFKELPDLINLTFNLRKYTLIQDISDMGKIGQEYLLNRNGSIPANDDDNPEYAEIGRRLMKSGDGIVTEHGILFVDDDIPFEEPYDGQVFPPYLYDNSILCIAKAEYHGKVEYLYLPCERAAIDKAFSRLGAVDPDTVSIILEDFNTDNSEWFRRLREFAATESIYDVNNLVGAINTADVDLDTLTYVVEYAGVEDAASIAKLANNLCQFSVFVGAEDYHEVGRRFAQLPTEYEVPDAMLDFIDCEKFGKYIADEYNGKFVAYGFVYMEQGYSLDDILDTDQGMSMGGM